MSYKLIKHSPYEDLFRLHSTLSKNPEGAVDVLQSPLPGPKVLRSSFRVFSKEAAHQLASFLSKLLNKRNRFLMELKDYSLTRVKTERKLYYHFKEFYEFQELTLAQELRAKKKANKNFESHELTHLLYNLVYACSRLQKQKAAVGNISEDNIFVAESDGKPAYKILLCNFSAAYSPDLFAKVAKKDLFKNNFSPELFSALMKGGEITLEDIIKSDVFCVGLLLLELGVSRKIKRELAARTLDNHLDLFEQVFKDNVLLTSCVRSMLGLSARRRPTFVELEASLPKYEIICSFLGRQSAGSDKKLKLTPTFANRKEPDEKILAASGESETFRAAGKQRYGDFINPFTLNDKEISKISRFDDNFRKEGRESENENLSAEQKEATDDFCELNFSFSTHQKNDSNPTTERKARTIKFFTTPNMSESESVIISSPAPETRRPLFEGKARKPFDATKVLQRSANQPVKENESFQPRHKRTYSNGLSDQSDENEIYLLNEKRTTKKKPLQSYLDYQNQIQSSGKRSPPENAWMDDHFKRLAAELDEIQRLNKRMRERPARFNRDTKNG